MSLLRATAIKFGNSIPIGWKSRLKWQLMIPDTRASLNLLRQKGFSPKHVLDIGGFIGDWTRMCKGVWPESNVCMFEPQPSKKARLEAICRELPGVSLKTALLGNREGEEVVFHLAESGSSTLDLLSKPSTENIVLRTSTLTSAVKNTPFAKPDLIKVDVQGAELRVLDGGQDVLAAAQVVMLEVSLVEEYVGSPLFAEVVAYMSERGFLVHDICTVWRNTVSGSMNEADVIFARKNSPLMDHRFYKR
jgi:FkbM family methyltransferase